MTCHGSNMARLFPNLSQSERLLLWKSILQVASLPSPCGRCHGAFHISILGSRLWCWQVRPGKCHENGHGVAWWNKKPSWNWKKSSSLRPLRFEKFSERTIKAVGSSTKLFGDVNFRWFVRKFTIFVSCKRLILETKKLSENDFVQAVMLAQEEAKKIQQAWPTRQASQADTLYMFEFVFFHTAARVRRTMLALKCWWWDCWKRVVVVQKLFNNWECTILRPLDQHFRGRW